MTQFDVVAAWIFLVAACVGAAYSILAMIQVRRFGRSPQPRTCSYPSVTILKPLHGVEPHLYENLASFVEQNYAGQAQIIFGVQDPRDPAAEVARELIAAYPERDLQLVIDPAVHGVNRKISNLINMAKAIRHGIVLVADSDVLVRPDYLAAVVGELEQPGVGMVTCLYSGGPEGGLPARLAAMAVDYHFLPSVLVGLGLGLAKPCFGSTMALNVDMLRKIGGFENFADCLADDNSMGEAVRRTGVAVTISSYVVTHVCQSHRLGDLIHQELRWAKTIRAVAPAGHFGSMLAHPLPFALLAAGFGDFDLFAPVIIGGALACRLALQRTVDAAVGSQRPRWHLAPLRDVLSFLVFVGSFFVTKVRWRGHRYQVHSDGRISNLRASAS